MFKRLIVLFASILTFFHLLAGSCQHPYQQGQALYELNCQRCHGDDGEGFEDLYPSINESPFLSNTESLSCLIVYGSDYLRGQQASDAATIMPDNLHLTSVEVLNIVNYLSFKMGDGRQDAIEKVTRGLEKCTPEK